jgi:hypothetical protein
MLGDEYEEPREVDLGEAYVLDGQLRLFKAILEVAVAYNLDFDDHGAYDFLDDDTNASLLRQLVRLDKEDADFMTLRPGNRMAQAKDLLLEAIGKLEAGLAAIRAENDDQHDDVIKKAHLTDLDEEVDLSSEDVPAFFRDMKTAEDALAKLREALEGTVAIEADYDGDEDTPDATLVFDLGRFFDQPVRDLRTLFPYHEWHPELLENRDFTDELVLTDARGAPLGASPPLVFPNPSANGILSNIQSSGQLLGLLGVTADNLNDRDLLYETGLVYSRDGGIVVTNSSSFDIEVVYSGEVGGEWIEGQSVSVRAGSPAVDAVRTSSGAPLRGDGYYTLVVTRASDGRVLYDSSRDYGYGMVAAPRPADQHRRLPKAAQISVGWWGRWVNGNIYVTVADEELVVETADRYWDDPANPYVATRVAISQSVTGDNHGLAGTPITAANIQQVVATVMQGIGQAMAKGPGTHNGANSGTVRIALSTGKPTQTIMYSCTFDDYSDDGQIFLNGTVRINMSGTTYSHTFDVDVTGAYAGAIEGEINMANGVYSGYWDIDGTRITF